MDAEQIVKRMENFESDRATWDNRYQDCANYGMPQNSQITVTKSPGAASTIELFDTTAEDSNIQLAAGLYSYMFPTDNKAFVLKIDDTELSEVDEVKTWLDKVTTTIHTILVQSNFRQAFFEFLKSLGCFGTACMYIEKGKKTPVNFQCIHIASFYIDVDNEGNIDTVYRSFEYTARQAVQEFGKEALEECEDIIVALDNDAQIDKKFKFIHAVYPRTDRDDTKDDPQNMPIVSKYVWRGGKKEISEGGYSEMPYMVDRFDKDSREKQGRSPMMKKLPDIKMINRMAKTRIKGWEKKTDPPIVIPDDGSIWPLATQPGGVLYKRAGSDDPFWFEFKGDMREMEEAIKTVQESIRKGFFLDYFDPYIDRKNMTATEIVARSEQTMRFLVPNIGRRQSNFCTPMIHRVIGILGRTQIKRSDGTVASLLPQLPDELIDAEYSVEYLGKLALVLKTLETEGLTKTLTEWAPLLEADPTPMDNLNKDQAFRDSSRNNGMPSTWLNSEDEVEQIRANRAEAQQQQAMAEQALNIAKAAKAGGTAPEDGSPTKELMDAA